MQELHLSDNLFAEALSLLKRLISIPSFSKEEDSTATALEEFFSQKGIPFNRHANNIWVKNKTYDARKPTILLNSHHDTVKPVNGWKRNPFEPTVDDGRLYGLGSNDACGALCALIATFCFYYEQPDLRYNLILAATAEEEISGQNGIACVLPQLGNIDFAIVGEPTRMQLAVAERGLLVLDVTVQGKSGHAARNEGENAIYKALPVIEWFRTFQFAHTSQWLGAPKMTVTQIHAGTQHNVIPDNCSFTVDIRYNELYSPESILEEINVAVGSVSEIKPRSLRLRPSGISLAHPVVQAANEMGMHLFGSETLSDCALIPYPSVKIGPGDSNRSHTADEYINISEVQDGIHIYTQLLSKLLYS